MKSPAMRSLWMISRAMALASAMSLPTSMPIHTSAHSVELVRLGSTAISLAPLRTPRSRWWKKIGWVSRAFEPQRMMTSVSSASRYDEVPPPAPNTVARPATLGACQVRLQLSMLLLCMTARVNFWAMKFISLVVFEQLNMPKACGPCMRAASNPAAALVRASSHDAGRSLPPSLTRGSVRRSMRNPILGPVGRDELLDAAQAELQLVLRLRIGKADEALARGTERRAREDGHAGLVEQPVRQVVLVEASALDVREDVEGPLRPVAAYPWDLGQAVDDQVAPVLEDLHHSAHGVLRLRGAERLDRRDLRERGRAGRGVDHQRVELGRERARRDRVAKPPARHRVGLRQAVHQHRPVAHAGAG